MDEPSIPEQQVLVVKHYEETSLCLYLCLCISVPLCAQVKRDLYLPSLCPSLLSLPLATLHSAFHPSLPFIPLQLVPGEAPGSQGGWARAALGSSTDLCPTGNQSCCRETELGISPSVGEFQFRLAWGKGKTGGKVSFSFHPTYSPPLSQCYTLSALLLGYP